MIDVVGRATAERRVRPVLVVPTNEERNLVAKRVATKRNEHATRAYALHGAHKALDDGDTAVLANRSESQPDVSLPGPPLEAVAPELAALVKGSMTMPRVQHVLTRSVKYR